MKILKISLFTFMSIQSINVIADTKLECGWRPSTGTSVSQCIVTECWGSGEDDNWECSSKIKKNLTCTDCLKICNPWAEC